MVGSRERKKSLFFEYNALYHLDSAKPFLYKVVQIIDLGVIKFDNIFWRESVIVGQFIK